MPRHTPLVELPDTPANDTASSAGARRRALSRNLRVTYWTGWLSPDMEGCSKEVFALKNHFPRSRIFGLSRYYTFKFSRRERYVGLNVRLYPLFRAIAPWYDRTSAINHIYGSLNEWFFLRAVKHRPLILTVATTSATDSGTGPRMHEHVRCFVTHSSATAADLTARGIPAANVRMIYPGVSLTRFRPQPRDAAPPDAWPAGGTGRFRVLFATAPNWREGLEARGVHLIMRAAARMPDVDFLLLWRPWPEGRELLDDLQRTYGQIGNVHVSMRLVPDMTRVFQAADATIAPFVTAAGTKVCPTSIVESLACGRPVLVSSVVGISDLVRNESCGATFEPTVDGLCQAVATLREHYAERQANARPAAERHFDEADCLRQYEELYAEMLGR